MGDKLLDELRAAAGGRVLLPLREAADLLGIPVGTIRNGISRRDEE